ncbi:unnamed protein product [marine sediment metagenome]|uniref:Uncharacterized protein n=1 Tax=marine sediment metagenome TaxID=412755 RepID=X1L7R4_9ZZZZ
MARMTNKTQGIDTVHTATFPITPAPLKTIKYMATQISAKKPTIGPIGAPSTPGPDESLKISSKKYDPAPAAPASPIPQAMVAELTT